MAGELNTLHSSGGYPMKRRRIFEAETIVRQRVLIAHCFIQHGCCGWVFRGYILAIAELYEMALNRILKDSG
jgi:hypothetical protein